MANYKTEVKNDVLTITVDLKTDLGRSKSGKSILIASSNGNADIEGLDGVKLGLTSISQ